MALVKTKVSTVVSKQTPQFVREEHENFISFLEAYYEWLEETYKIRDLENIRDVDSTIDEFVSFFRNELLNQIPEYVLNDKRYLAKVIQDVYRSKGTVKSYEFLFRALFDEVPELYFPKVDMLRISDGKFNQQSILRVSALQGNPLDLLAKTVVVLNDNADVVASVRIENIIASQVGAETIFALTLNETSIIGQITPESILQTTDTPFIAVRARSGVVSFEATNGGSYYEIGDPVRVISGSGSGAVVQVAEINNNGVVSDIIVDDPGTGYAVNQEIIFNNSNAGGAASNPLVSARAIISEVDQLGGIKRVKLLSGGNFYTKLPLAIPPNTGTGANLLAISKDIGKITKLNVPSFGLDFENPPNGIAPAYIVMKDISTEFSIGEIVRAAPQSVSMEDDFELLLEDGNKILLEGQQTPEGVLISSDTDRNVYKIFPVTDRFGIGIEETEGTLLSEEGNQFVTEESAEFRNNFTVEGFGANGLAKSGSTGKIISINQAELKGSIAAIGKTLGTFLNADGKISESSKRIQDSRFYQEFSYVIKVGQSIDKYRNVVRKLLHPVGLALFGEVQIQSPVEAKSSLYDIPRNRTVERVKLVIEELINLKTRALGAFRTPFEQDLTAQKQQVTIFLEDFVASILTIRVSTAEFLPVLNFPNLTPQEVHLLDLRTEIGESYRAILLERQIGNKVRTATNYYEKELDVNPDRTDESIKFGNRLNWLEKWKFAIAPYEAGTKNTIGIFKDEWNQTYPGLQNQNYWAIGSTQIKDFADISVFDIINSPNKRVNYAFESFIDVVALPRGAITFDTISAGPTFDNDLAYRMDADSIEMDTTAYTMDSNFFRVRFDNLT